MQFTSPILAVFLAALASATPTKTLQARASQCSQYAEVTTGSYIVYNNLWGESSASSGSQCFSVTGLSGSTLSWDTTWSWSGGTDSVKSYANAVYKFTSKQLSAISSMKSTWSWSYIGSNLVADVSYDMFTSSSAGGSNEYEIMVWLAALGGAGPISSQYGSNGKPVPIASTTVGGNTFSLYSGPNGATTVYSFVATSQVASFNGDIYDFFKYLISEGHIASSQYLTSVGAGTEPFTGSNASFQTKAYSMNIS